MKKKLFFSGIGFLILTLLCSVYINQYHYISADGVLHESFATPIAAFSSVLGILALLFALALYVVDYIRR